MYGDQVVLSYTVGDTQVLESPGLAIEGEQRVYARTINIAKSSADMLLQVAQQPGEKIDVVSLASLESVGKAGPADDNLAVFGSPSAGPSVTAFAVAGAAKVTEWRLTDDATIRLAIPAAATPAKFKILIWKGATDTLSAFQSAVNSSEAAADLSVLTNGGPPRWPEVVATKGQLGEDEGGFATDVISWPADIPWKSWMRFGGFDFFKDVHAQLSALGATMCGWSAASTRTLTN